MHGGPELTRGERQYLALRGWFHAATHEVMRLRQRQIHVTVRSRALNGHILELEAEIARLKAEIERRAPQS